MAHTKSPFKVGDLVGYKSVQDDPEFSHIGRVYEVYDNGMPSHRRPMVKLEGKAGMLDVEHCTLIPAPKEPGARLMAALGAILVPEGTFECIPSGPERNELQAAYDELLAAMEPKKAARIMAIIGPEGKIHYTRPEGDPLLAEAQDEIRKRIGYTVMPLDEFKAREAEAP